jgi:hypothetical protein
LSIFFVQDLEVGEPELRCASADSNLPPFQGVSDNFVSHQQIVFVIFAASMKIAPPAFPEMSLQ